MYRSFEANNFRCFDHLKLDGLERVNLIAGMNNVGKTALLEALLIHFGSHLPELTVLVSAFRGLEAVRFRLGASPETPWDSLFGQFDASRTVELVSSSDKTGRRAVKLKVLRTRSELAEAEHFMERAAEPITTGLHSTEVAPFVSSPAASGSVLTSAEAAQVLMVESVEEEETSKYFAIIGRNGVRTFPVPPFAVSEIMFLNARVRTPPSEDAERFGRLEIQGKQDMVVRASQVLEPRLKRIAMVVASGKPVLHGDIGIGHLVPLPLMGEGVVRLASLILCIGNAENGVVLVDEIENGLHWTVLTKVWAAIADAARQFNTQIFATTHSHECIVAAHEAFSEGGLYDFRLHRLDRVNGAMRVVTYDEGTLGAAIETNLEVR